jgi:MerR family transcriptional regulator/heat shock protein HspR
MDKEFWTIEEVVATFQIDRELLEELEREEIICPTCAEPVSAKTLSIAELEKLNLARLLIEEMDVNLAGVEVILRMRQSMLEMRCQFDQILEDLAGQIRRRFLDSHG